MKLRRIKRKSNFTQVDNRIAQNYFISPDTKGILLHLLSFHPEQDISIELFKDQLAKAKAQNPAIKIPGRERFRAIMREIIQLGYAALQKNQNPDGTFKGSSYLIFDTPEDKDWFFNREPKNCTPGFTEGPKNRLSVKPSVGKPAPHIYNTVNTNFLEYNTVCENAHTREENFGDNVEDAQGESNSSETLTPEIPLTQETQNSEGGARAESTYGAQKLAEAQRNARRAKERTQIGYNTKSQRKSNTGENKGQLRAKELDPLFDRNQGKLLPFLFAQREIALTVLKYMGNDAQQNVYKARWGIHPTHDLKGLAEDWAGWYMNTLIDREYPQNIPDYVRKTHVSKMFSNFQKTFARNAVTKNPLLAKPKVSRNAYNPNL